jgi:regulator of protease activity HflC (stomatin/prohibitin superfamily)
MKRFIFALTLALFALSFTSCDVCRVDGTEEGVFVKQPWFFGDGGVSQEPLTSGSEWKVFTTRFYTYSSVPTRFDETFDDIASDDGTPIDMTAHIVLKLKPGKSPVLHQNYGPKWYENNIKEIFREAVRNFISTYDMRSLISEREIYDTVKIDIMQRINAYITSLSTTAEFPIEVCNVIVDKARPNAGVLEELNNTAIKMQQKQTAIMEQQMQEERRITEHKRALADKEYQATIGFSPQQFIALKSLELENQKIEMIKNKKNVNVDVMIGTNTGIPVWGIKEK